MDSKTADISELAVLAGRYRSEFLTNAAKLFTELERIEPSLAARLVEALGGRARAALWVLWPNRALGGEPPILALARGRREAVISELGQIEHGLLG